MKIICCRCSKEYLMDDNLFKAKKTSHPLLKCPHCGFEHILDFIPIEKKIETPEYRRIAALNLQNYDIILHATRIADKDRVDESGSDDGDVTGWTKTDEFIIAPAFHTNSKGVRACVLKLQWREVIAGSFADVASTGEIHYTTTTTVLSDDTDVVVGERLCSTYGDTWQNGLENENDNVAPDSGTYTLAEDYETEFHWALDPASAVDGKEYEFKVVDTNNGVDVGVCGATITMVSVGPTPNAYNQIQYTSEPPTASAWNQIKQDTGTGWIKIFYDSD